MTDNDLDMGYDYSQRLFLASFSQCKGIRKPRRLVIMSGLDYLMF
jgi:hypothetical protein